jgi:hypothetical protein
MKLSSQDVSYLTNILQTCSVGSIETMIIEDGTVRGINAEKNFAIISNHEVPKLSQKMGISRIPALRQRLELFASNPATTIEAKETDRGEISSLEISAGRNKAQFRCTSTMLVKAPKSINDEPIFRVFIKREELKLVLSAIRVMAGKNVQLVIKKDRSATIALTDSTNDAFTAVLETPVEVLGAEQDSVVHYYLADIISSALRAGPDTDITELKIGSRGAMWYGINGHPIVILPKINEDSED